MTITKEEIQEKIGKKSWLDNQQILAAKLDYIRGISVFDEILSGKTLKEIDAVIHLEKYPNGLLFKIVQGIGLKTISFPVSSKEIRKVLLTETSNNIGQLSFELNDKNKIEFLIIEDKINEVKDFLKSIKLEFETEVKKTTIGEINSYSFEFPKMIANELIKFPTDLQQEFLEEYNRKKRKVSIGYLLWFFIGLHYGYCNKWGLQVAFWITGGGVLIWLIADLFRMPSIIDDRNRDISIEIMKNFKAIRNK